MDQMVIFGHFFRIGTIKAFCTFKVVFSFRVFKEVSRMVLVCLKTQYLGFFLGWGVGGVFLGGVI